jgi:hypothetical protein
MQITTPIISFIILHFRKNYEKRCEENNDSKNAVYEILTGCRSVSILISSTLLYRARLICNLVRVFLTGYKVWEW